MNAEAAPCESVFWWFVETPQRRYSELRCDLPAGHTGQHRARLNDRPFCWADVPNKRKPPR